MVQGSLSAKHGPLAGACRQPKPLAQLSVVHGLASSQSSAVPGWHWPPLQLSSTVQGLPSVHGPAVGCSRQPVLGSQPGSEHGPTSGQSASTPTHLPPGWQFSAWVQASPSSQTPEVTMVQAVLLASGKQRMHGSMGALAPSLEHRMPKGEAILQ